MTTTTLRLSSDHSFFSLSFVSMHNQSWYFFVCEKYYDEVVDGVRFFFIDSSIGRWCCLQTPFFFPLVHVHINMFAQVLTKYISMDDILGPFSFFLSPLFLLYECVFSLSPPLSSSLASSLTYLLALTISVPSS